MKAIKGQAKNNAPPRPLLDRFLDSEINGTPEEYMAVIMRDLEALLNTRADRKLNEGSPLTVLDYGLHDFTADNLSDDGILKLSLAIKKSIEIFEPRLSQVKVEPLPGAAAIDQFTVRVTAQLAGFENRPELVLDWPLKINAAAF